MTDFPFFVHSSPLFLSMLAVPPPRFLIDNPIIPLKAPELSVKRFSFTNLNSRAVCGMVRGNPSHYWDACLRIVLKLEFKLVPPSLSHRKDGVFKGNDFWGWWVCVWNHVDICNIWYCLRTLIFGYWGIVLNFKFFGIIFIFWINVLDWILTYDIVLEYMVYHVDIWILTYGIDF